MTISKIQTPEDVENCRVAFEKVFIPDISSTTPFTLAIKSKALLYPVGHTLSRELFAALQTAARSVGDTAFYLTRLDPLRDISNGIDWVISLNESDYIQFHQYNYVRENSVYSPQGKWGITCWDPMITLIGGTEEFVNEFFSYLDLGRREKYLDAFLRQYKEKVVNDLDPDYVDISIFLRHIYGEETSALLAIKYSLKK